MLAFKPQKRYRSKSARNRPNSPSDEEAPFAQPTEVVPVVLAQDEEGGARNATHADVLEDEETSEKDLPAPPPIYGNWRGSVVSPIPIPL